MDLKELKSTTINRHPWEKSRVGFFKKIIEKHIIRHDNVSKILDIGSGDGHFARSLLASNPDNFQIYDPQVAQIDELREIIQLQASALEASTPEVEASTPELEASCSMTVHILRRIKAAIKRLMTYFWK